MKLIKFTIRIAIFPVILSLTVMQWLFTYIAGMSAVIFRLLAGVLFLTAVFSYGFGLDDGAECMKVLAGGFICYILPYTAVAVTAGIVIAKEALKSLI
ncbi:MAG: hypothetical protein EOM18_09945 [Clostridia bacterium]|nr:hypothetical protein [Clostridia bacterium]